MIDSLKGKQWRDLASGNVMTVCGLMPAKQMGITLPHEHVLINHSENVLLDDPALAVEELIRFRQLNGNTVVNMSNIGLGREPEVIRKISQESKVNIIMGAGYYKDQWHPNSIDSMAVDDIEREIVNDVLEGMDGTDIKAGVIGEIGISGKMTDNEEKVLIASARAQLKTGAALSIHFDIGAPASLRSRAVDIVENEGGNLKKVILCHFGKSEDLDCVLDFVSRGCCVEYDLFMFQATFPIEERAALFRELIRMGFLDKIMISTDICVKGFLHKYGGNGYSHILKNVVPALIEHGISHEEMQTIITGNPQKIFQFSF